MRRYPNKVNLTAVVTDYSTSEEASLSTTAHYRFATKVFDSCLYLILAGTKLLAETKPVPAHAMA